MKGFTPPAGAGIGDSSLGTASLHDGAAPPPCKDSAAPTPAPFWFPYLARRCSDWMFPFGKAPSESRGRRRGVHWRKATRIALRERDGDNCCYCREVMNFTMSGRHDDDDFATIEHVTPLGRGGSDDMENLALAHRRCNHAKNEGLI